jgi:hypothetical protein
MTDQNAQPGPESKPDAGGVSRCSLFRTAGVGYKALTSVNDPHNKDEAASSKNPAPGVAITPPVGIQWQKITGDLLPTFK